MADLQRHPVSPHPPRNPWPWIALIMLLFVVGGIAAFWMTLRGPEQAGKSLIAAGGEAAKEVISAFGKLIGAEPKVTNDSTVAFAFPTGIAEAAVLQTDAIVENSFENSHFGSTKRMRSRGVYVVKIGYDLTQSIEIVENSDGSVQVTLPQPKVLSATPASYEELAYQDGLWNKINPQDREAQIAILNAKALHEAANERNFEQAKRELKKRLETLAPGRRIDISHTTAMPRAS